MLKKSTTIGLIIILFTALSMQTHAQDKKLSGREIMLKVDNIPDGDDRKSTMHITLINHRGRTRERTVLSYQKDYGKDTKTIMYFLKPADVKGIGFLSYEYDDLSTNDDRWLYLPALDLVKRIAASDKRTSFVGSDFLYEDVSGRSLQADKHVLIGTDANYYIVENTPVAADEVEFSKYIMYIHKTTFLPISTEYYDKQGVKYKTYTALAVDTVEGRPTITKSEAKNLQTGGSTLMEYSSVQYDVGIPDDIFSERYLRKPPRKLLR
ncbi:MAG: outer membrane lipoprotein-sorting protein [Methylococcales bacterium]|nr:outer membrane lipoprotein-sorting protein [Methylococcales bacterium]